MSKEIETTENDVDMTEVPEKLPDGTYKPVLTKKDLDRCGLRWNMAVLTYNYETQQAPSCVFATFHALEKIYRGDADGLNAAVLNQFKYFNTTPQPAGLLLGAGIALEDRGHNNSLDAETDLKIGFMGPLAGISDTIFWLLIPTIMGSLAAYMGLDGNPLGVFIWLAINIAVFYWKIHNWNTGYKFGTQLLSGLAERISNFTESASILGLTVVGAMIPTAVKIKTAVTYQMGDVQLGVQEGILDKILPAMLPVIATIIVYNLVKKHVNMNVIICCIILFALVCSFFGILA